MSHGVVGGGGVIVCDGPHHSHTIGGGAWLYVWAICMGYMYGCCVGVIWP